jgi:hypothetical protein
LISKVSGLQKRSSEVKSRLKINGRQIDKVKKVCKGKLLHIFMTAMRWKERLCLFIQRGFIA